MENTRARVPARTQRRQPARRQVKKIRRAQARRSAFVMMLVVLFCMFSIVLVYQRNAINALDSQIRDLEQDYKQAVMINDDLEGQLLQARNINEVERYAKETLGMVKPGSNDVTYVAYDKPENTTNASAMPAEEQSFMSWMKNLFQ